MTYHIGLVKQGDMVIVEVARSVDQLSCELWHYCGERETSFAALKRNSNKILGAINQDHGKNFSRIIIRKISEGDFTAGHAA